MSLTFPYQYIGKNIFGDLYRPYTTLRIMRTKEPRIWIERTLIIDTGADYTIFPYSDSFVFGIDCKRECIKEMTYGVGGRKKVFLFKSLVVRLGAWERKIPVGFLEDSSIPALMGRQLCLDLFSLHLTDNTALFNV